MELYEHNKVLTYFDPLLFPILLRICPAQEMVRFFNVLPPYCSCQFLGNKLKTELNLGHTLMPAQVCISRVEILMCCMYFSMVVASKFCMSIQLFVM